MFLNVRGLLLALSLGISVYNSGFIAENVRASIGAIGQGQRDAARAVGLSPGRTMRLVIFPQALQTLLPPLTNNYLNIIKSTTLAGLSHQSFCRAERPTGRDELLHLA